jgi:hypothetical protein
MMDAGKFWGRVKRDGKTGIAKGTFASWKSRGIMPRVDEAYHTAEALGHWGVSVDRAGG